LSIEPFESGSLAPATLSALEEEGERLIRFVEPDAKKHEVRFTRSE
jgi:hypothetical protein